MFSRRALLFGSIALAATGCALQSGPQYALDRRFKRQRVQYQTNEKAGSIVVDTRERYLYAVEGNGYALRYGVAVGQEGLTLKGRASVGRKEEWPSWTPTASMIDRKPHLIKYAGGVPGGPNNPLGLRWIGFATAHGWQVGFHGTAKTSVLGQAVSHGCVRMANPDIVEVYGRVKIGTEVVVE